ncbi:TPA: hypothetical protein RQK02_004388 [Vibrio vulnificus]|nr:hypothetical protein [Vibrio vulnificus]HAS6359594.1 hypothetical protein [Vibrio vulnificus]HDY7608215.1 hypothetical protein [Vibrio vulnificus]HDY7699550.1 hypothetical protein [Vibrio vulnificus]
MNYHNIPKFIKILSSASVSSVLWVCLFGLEVKRAFDGGFSFSKVINLVTQEDHSTYSINTDMLNILWTKSLSVHIFAILIISLVSTALLAHLVKRQTTKKLSIGESHRIRVVKFRPHENELLLKSSALVTIITVLHTASNDLAFIATILLTFYSPIWPYNSLITIRGIVFAKASVILDAESDIRDDFVIVTTTDVIESFTYNPKCPQRMDIILYNKVSIIR